VEFVQKRLSALSKSLGDKPTSMVTASLRVI
jgi:hypothetical protein